MAQNVNTSFCFRPSVYIFTPMIAYYVSITRKISEYGYDLEIKGQGQIFLKTVTLLIIQTPLWCIDGMCSYLAQQLHLMCRLKSDLQIVDMTLRSKVKVTNT